MVGRLACILALGLCAFAQTEEPKIVVNLDGFRYPTIAVAARIKGDVFWELTASSRKLMTGKSPILTDAARKNLDGWTLPPRARGRYVVRYHFVITGKVCQPTSTSSVRRTQSSKGSDVLIDIFVIATLECGHAN